MLRYRSFSDIANLSLCNLNNYYQWSLLGQLPSLKFLSIKKIKTVRRVGPEFYETINSSVRPFPSLVILVLQGMTGGREWFLHEAGRQGFPLLEYLHIERCHKLKGSLPALPPSNTSVEISECPKLVVKFPRKDYLFLNDGNKLLQRRHKELVYKPSQFPVIEEMPLLPDSKRVELSSDDEVPLFKTDDSTTSESFPPESSVLMTEDSSIRSEDASPIPLHKTEMPIVRSETDDRISKGDAEDSLQDISSSISLRVSEMSQLTELPPGLCSLKIKGCDALKSLPELIHGNPCLRHLYIIDCCFFKSFHGGHPPIALKTLYIRNCRKLELFSLAEAIRQSLLIENLCIGSSCDSLTSFPLALFPKLRSFVIWDSENFSSISVDKEHMSLDTLEIRDCHKLVSFPKGGLRTPNLTSIVLSNCKNLKVLPDQLHRLESLRSLFINECPELILIPEGGFPDNLEVLCISSCLNLTPSIAWGLHKLENLSRFEIEGGCRDLESFPKQKLLPDNLISLRISRLPNLKFVDYKGLQHLTSLETLQINCCRKLRSLPEEGLPSSLTSLYISECSLLKAKIQNKKGFDWYNIAHIPHIQIDEDIIS